MPINNKNISIYLTADFTDFHRLKNNDYKKSALICVICGLKNHQLYIICGSALSYEL
jgi:hypothetical protein